MEQQDLNIIKSLISTGVLGSTEELLITKPTAFVFCNDGHKFEDQCGHGRSLIAHGCVLHPVPFHGGSFCLSPNAPGNEDYDFPAFLKQIRIGCGAKNLEVLLLSGHWQCAWASSHVSLRETLEWCALGHQNIARAFPVLEVISLFHVDYGKNKMKTYLFDTQQWVTHSNQIFQPSNLVAATA